MTYATVENQSGHVTIVNTDHITYLRQDNYGTAVHFSSGEHIVCPMEIEALVERLWPNAPERPLLGRAQ